MKGHDFKLIISLLAKHFTRSEHIISVRAGPLSTLRTDPRWYQDSKCLQGPILFPGIPVVQKYKEYNRNLMRTYRNRYGDIEENPIPDRMGPVPIVTWTPIRALLAVALSCRPVFSRSGNLLPDPHLGPDHSKVSRGRGHYREWALNSKVY